MCSKDISVTYPYIYTHTNTSIMKVYDKLYITHTHTKRFCAQQRVKKYLNLKKEEKTKFKDEEMQTKNICVCSSLLTAAITKN